MRRHWYALAGNGRSGMAAVPVQHIGAGTNDTISSDTDGDNSGADNSAGGMEIESSDGNSIRGEHDGAGPSALNPVNQSDTDVEVSKTETP